MSGNPEISTKIHDTSAGTPTPITNDLFNNSYSSHNKIRYEKIDKILTKINKTKIKLLT